MKDIFWDEILLKIFACLMLCIGGGILVECVLTFDSVPGLSAVSTFLSGRYTTDVIIALLLISGGIGVLLENSFFGFQLQPLYCLLLMYRTLFFQPGFQFENPIYSASNFPVACGITLFFLVSSVIAQIYMRGDYFWQSARHDRINIFVRILPIVMVVLLIVNGVKLFQNNLGSAGSLIEIVKNTFSTSSHGIYVLFFNEKFGLFSRSNIFLLSLCILIHFVIRFSLGIGKYDLFLRNYRRKQKHVRSQYALKEDVLEQYPEHMRDNVIDDFKRQLKEKVDEETLYYRKECDELQPFHKAVLFLNLVLVPAIILAVLYPYADGLAALTGFIVYPFVFAAVVTVILFRERLQIITLLIQAAIVFVGFWTNGWGLFQISFNLSEQMLLLFFVPFLLWQCIGAVYLLMYWGGAAIGVAFARNKAYLSVTDVKKPVEPKYEVAGYRCGRCNAELTENTGQCPSCGAKFRGVSEQHNEPRPKPIIVSEDVWDAKRIGRCFAVVLVLPVVCMSVLLMFLNISRGHGLLILLFSFCLLLLARGAAALKWKSVYSRYQSNIIERTVGTYIP